ncbi:unnamed protein product [Ciceribacter selenitireducens ATCC BAA-1503]|uniref:Uncharacterized protein n=1 Tax=Ciceribacter selenitireducens ATCC BAA-1503 TaxID=1336235 RepID=A0A376ALM9_9HYPH|nr:unnamed protein product [Ciceribacter selenitireducens ATCC BAA-1503]
MAPRSSRQPVGSDITAHSAMPQGAIALARGFLVTLCAEPDFPYGRSENPAGDGQHE